MENSKESFQTNVFLHPMYYKASPRSHIFRDALLRISNFGDIWGSMGSDIAREVHSEILSRIQRLLGSSGLATADGESGVGLVVWDATCTLFRKKFAMAEGGAWLLAMIRDLSLEAVDTEKGPVHARIELVSNRGFAGVAERAASKADMIAPSEWDDAGRTFRSDMAAVSPVLRALGGFRWTGGDSEDVDVDVSWCPVLAVPGRAGATFYEASITVIGANGTLRPGNHAIAAAERLGLAHHIDQYLVATVLEQLWAGPPSLVLMVPVSVSTLQAGGFWDDALLVLESRPEMASRLIFDLRGSTDNVGWDQARDRIAQLRAAGCRLSFGQLWAGGASVRNIFSLKPEMVRIEPHFLFAARTSPASEDALFHLVGFARAFGAEVIVDGVETESDAWLAAAAGAVFRTGGWLGGPRLSRPWFKGSAEDII